MGALRKTRIGEFAAALALLGTLVYIALTPWHFASQLEMRLLQAEFGGALSILCDTSQTNPDGAPSGPQNSALDCPVCGGLSSFHVALAPPSLVALAARVTHRPAPPRVSASAADAPELSPRSRGPPPRA